MTQGSAVASADFPAHTRGERFSPTSLMWSTLGKVIGRSPGETIWSIGVAAFFSDITFYTYHLRVCKCNLCKSYFHVHNNKQLQPVFLIMLWSRCCRVVNSVHNQIQFQFFMSTFTSRVVFASCFSCLRIFVSFYAVLSMVLSVM